MIRSMWVVLIPIIVSVGTLTGCGAGDNSTEPGSLYDPPEAGSGLGLLAVQLEAYGGPLDSDWHRRDHDHGDHTEISSLNITFDSIRVYAACENPDSSGWQETDPCHGEHRGEEHDGPFDDGEYLELLTEPMTLDVMDLGPALTTLLGTMELPAGDYAHVVLHIIDASVVTLNGEEVTVNLPDDTGVFVPVPIRFTIRDGEVTEIVIVNDLTRSIREDPPGSGDFFLTPHMEGHQRHGDHDHGDGDHDGDGELGGDHGDEGHHGHGNGGDEDDGEEGHGHGGRGGHGHN